MPTAIPTHRSLQKNKAQPKNPYSKVNQKSYTQTLQNTPHSKAMCITTDEKECGGGGVRFNNVISKLFL